MILRGIQFGMFYDSMSLLFFGGGGEEVVFLQNEMCPKVLMVSKASLECLFQSSCSLTDASQTLD